MLSAMRALSNNHDPAIAVLRIEELMKAMKTQEMDRWRKKVVGENSNYAAMRCKQDKKPFLDCHGDIVG